MINPPNTAILSSNRYGKKQVRFLRVDRTQHPYHQVYEYHAQILLESPTFDRSYSHGDNSDIVPTESQKNTLYVLSKKFPVDPLENWVLKVAEDFLQRHTHLSAINLEVEKMNWERAVKNPPEFFTEKKKKENFSEKKEEYSHVFCMGSGVRFCSVRKERNGPVIMTCGFKDLTLMKTAQSGFDGYIKDEYTSLKETTDRILSTKIYCEWTYNLSLLHSPLKNLGESQNFNDYFHGIRQEIITQFGGLDTKNGVYSASVQHSVHMMATQVLEKFPMVQKITFKLPNIHYYLVNFNEFKTDLKNNNEVFQTYDGAYGHIEATFERSTAKL